MENTFIFGKREDDVEEFVSWGEVSTIQPLPNGGYKVSLRCSDHHTYFVRDFQRYSVQDIEAWSRKKFLSWTNWQGENRGGLSA